MHEEVPQPRDGSNGPILVVGGTGALGASVVRRLVARGFPVRVLAREPERACAAFGNDVEVIPGDVEDDRAIEAAVHGCSGVHVSLAGGSDPAAIERVEHLGTARVATAAARARLACLTYLSGMYVSRELAAHSSADAAKWRAEEAIRASGVPYVIFRPTYFMETLPRHVQGHRAIVLGRQSHALHMVAASDFGDQVARAMVTPAAQGRELYVQGPDALTLADALREYCRVVRPELSVMTVPLPVMRVANTLFAGGRLTRELRLMAMLQRLGEQGDPTEANRLLGAPQTTLTLWCEFERARQSSTSVAERSRAVVHKCATPT